MAKDIDLNGIELLDTYLIYLDALRESGVTNMWGAVPYLQDEFPELSEKQARKVHAHWMQTFSERQQQKESKGA